MFNTFFGTYVIPSCRGDATMTLDVQASASGFPLLCLITEG